MLGSGLFWPGSPGATRRSRRRCASVRSIRISMARSTLPRPRGSRLRGQRTRSGSDWPRAAGPCCCSPSRPRKTGRPRWSCERSGGDAPAEGAPQRCRMQSPLAGSGGDAPAERAPQRTSSQRRSGRIRRCPGARAPSYRGRRAEPGAGGGRLRVDGRLGDPAGRTARGLYRLRAAPAGADGGQGGGRAQRISRRRALTV